jgi:subtilisin family serine protease
MRKYLNLLYLLMILSLVACGSDKTATISSGSSSEGGSIKISAQAILAQAAKGNYKEGELLVKFKSGVVTSSSQKVHAAVGSSVVKKYNIVPNLELVQLSKGVSVQQAIQSYMSDPNVEYAEPNYIIRAAIAPNDPYFRNQWALYNDGSYAGGTSGADIKAPSAWDISTGSSSIVIAVFDTGIDYKHPDLVGNIWTNPGESSCTDGYDEDGNGFSDDCYGWNFVDNNNNPKDDDGHGTHVAGIIAATGNNGNGIAGVMWHAKLMAVKILDEEGVGQNSELIEAINYVVSLKQRGVNIRVINASLGGNEYSKAVEDTIWSANAEGILFIAAAGNGGEDGIGDNNDLIPFYPASYRPFNIISVAATDQNDARVPFSNFGVNSVHVAAPGVYTFSTVPYVLNQSGYGILEYKAGTSMAAPHVSGLAGLLFSYYDGVQNTSFNCWQVRNTILRYVDTNPTLVGWISTGGRINAYKALSSLLVPTNLTAKTTQSPTKVSLSWEDNATGEAGYKVERSTSGGPFTEIQTLPAGTSSYDDSSATVGTSYTYRVKAFNDFADSFNSNDASITVPQTGHSGGGGGGCSIGGGQNTATAFSDLIVLIIPFVFVAVMRRRI